MKVFELFSTNNFQTFNFEHDEEFTGWQHREESLLQNLVYNLASTLPLSVSL